MAKEHLPIYGVGPFYGVGIIAATVIGIVLSVTGVIKGGRIENAGLIAGFIVIGLVIFLLGFFVWKAAALGSKSIDKYIESNTLCTTGVYSIVRNPCYSGIMLMCTGLWILRKSLFYSTCFCARHMILYLKLVKTNQKKKIFHMHIKERHHG